MFQDNANCLTANPKIFFSAKIKDRELAMSLCNSCPVKSECLEFALKMESVDGIFGATTGEQRKAMMK